MKENGIIRCVRDFVADQLATAEINEGKICTDKGKYSPSFILDMWYTYLRNHIGRYNFVVTGDVPICFIKTEIKIRNKTIK